MAAINLNVKIKAGPCTPISVEVYGTAVNEKTITLANGQTITGSEIARWIEQNLSAALNELANRQ